MRHPSASLERVVRIFQDLEQWWRDENGPVAAQVQRTEDSTLRAARAFVLRTCLTELSAAVREAERISGVGRVPFVEQCRPADAKPVGTLRVTLNELIEAKESEWE